MTAALIQNCEVNINVHREREGYHSISYFVMLASSPMRHVGR